MRNAEVLKPGKRADGRRYQIISDEKKCADDGNDFAAMPHAGINTSPVRIQAADDHVVDPDERGQHAHQRDQPERSVAGDGKRKTDDVGLARAPVAVKNRGRAFPVDIARTLNIRCDQKLDSIKASLARRGACLRRSRYP